MDPDSWWLPIVCSGRGQHAREALGIAYEHAIGGITYDGPHIHRDGARAEDPDRPRSAALADVPHLGSVNITCPRCAPQTKRCPRVAWLLLLDAARRDNLTKVDISGLP